MEQNQQNMAWLFGLNPDIHPDERERVLNELQKIGGKLTFKVNQDKDGWMAQCDELPGIIASNTNPNPSKDEIESQIRDSIFTAFNVHFEKKPISVESPLAFTYSFAN